MDTPVSVIEIKDGKVISFDQRMNCNGAECTAIKVQRQPDGVISCYMGDDQGGQIHRGTTLAEALTDLHEPLKVRCLMLFTLPDATAEAVQRAGFKGYEIRTTSTQRV